MFHPLTSTRNFLLLLLVLTLVFPSTGSVAQAAERPAFATDRPNFLWLVIEDTSAYEFGCYGHPDVKTPTLDRLASRGTRYTRAWSNGPQCSTARSGLITGCYATTYNMDQHSYEWQQPEDIPLYPPLFRKAGYYCTNNKKTHYNIDIDHESLWDENHRDASYLSEKRKNGQPFFAVFNSAQTHMSRLISVKIDGRRDFAAVGLDPGKLQLPPHVPDLPRIRSDYAFHLEGVQDIDHWVELHLDKLKEVGLEEDTIVFFYSDHGGCMPRSKGWAYWTGQNVPLIVYVPQKWQAKMGFTPGTVSDELVSFVDFAPTILSMMGQDVPKQMQGRPFLGPQKGSPRKYQFGFATNGWRNYIPARTVTDGRFQYIRNYTPHRPDCLRNQYQWAMPSNLAWDDYVLHHGGTEEQWTRAYRPLKAERLYDIKSDPFQLNDLSEKREMQVKLHELRKQVSVHLRESGDLGFFPPLCRKAIQPAHTWIRENDYDLRKLHRAAETASEGDIANVDKLHRYLQSKRPEIRFWGASGYSAIAVKHPNAHCPQELIDAMNDVNGQVATAAAEAVALMGKHDQALAALTAMANNKPKKRDLDNWLTSSFNRRSLAFATLATLALYEDTRPMVHQFLRQQNVRESAEEDLYDISELRVNLGLDRAEILYEFDEERQNVNSRVRSPKPLP